MAASKTLNFDIFGHDRTASKAIRGVQRSVGGLGSAFGKLGAIIGVTFAAREIVQFGKESVAAFVDAEKAQATLADAFTRFPALADTNIKALQKLNSALALKTGFDDDATASGQAVLAQFGLTGAQLKKLTPLLQDYARKTNQDLPAAAESLGKALLGQGRALKAVGIDFHNTGSLAGNFDQVIAGLTEKVGGYAEVFGTTAAGKFEILTMKWGEFQEKVGEALLPGLSKLADFAGSDILPGLQAAAQWFATDGVAGFKNFFDWVVKYKDILGPAAVALGVLTVAQWALNVAMDSNPIGAVILGLGLLVAAGTLVATNWEFVSNVLVIAAQMIELSFVSSINAALSVLNAFLDPLNKIIGAINWLTGSNFQQIRFNPIEFNMNVPGQHTAASTPGGRAGGRTTINVMTSDPGAAAAAVAGRLNAFAGVA